MAYLKQCLWVFNKLFIEKYPILYDHLKKLGVIEEVWVLKWLMTAFTICFDLNVAVRIWDYFLIDKVKALY